MRVLLIHPPDSKVSLAPGRFEPLALEVLAAVIPAHEVRILDLRIDDLNELDNQLTSFHPTVAGITVNNTVHVNQAKRILNHIRKRNPEILLVVGGFHATMLPEDFYNPGIHAIFLGWAEKSFPEYIDSLENGKSFEKIPGIEILENGKLLLHNDGQWDLKASEIPFPRRDLIKKYQKKYRSDMGYRTSLVNTTRGCTNRCSFCGVWQVTGGHFLMRKAEDVFHEIAELPSFIHRVFFADDNTFINPTNAGKLCSLIREGKIRKKYSGYCRSDTIIRYPELMREWKEIGLDNLCVGFEGTDSERLHDLNKKNTASNNEQAARILNEIGIPFRPHFLIEPSFEKEDFSNLLHYVGKHHLKSPIFPILTPIPGTEYYFKEKNNIRLDYDYYDYAHAVVPTRMSPKDFYRSWIDLYYKSYPLWKNLMYFFLNTMAKITGNKDRENKYRHLRLVNLFMLRFFGIFLNFKLVRHYRSLEKMGNKTSPYIAYLKTNPLEH